MQADLKDGLIKMRKDHYTPEKGWHTPGTEYAALSEYIEATHAVLLSKLSEVKDLTASLKRCATILEKDSVEMADFLNEMGTHKKVK